MVYRYCDLKVQRDELVKDQKKMQELLANSLPKVVIRQVQDKGEKPIIDGFGTILFADIVSFTVFSGTVNAVELVQILNRMFVLNDELAAELNVEKIKTLGDCYVAATGVLTPMPDHAAQMIWMGLGMHKVMQQLNDEFNLDLHIRVGCNSGSVVGGVVGKKKLAFDIWGRTVDVANWMESEGVPDRVHVSQETYLRARTEGVLRFKKRETKIEFKEEKIQTYVKETVFVGRKVCTTALLEPLISI